MSKLILPPDPTLKDIQHYVDEMELERGFKGVTLLETYLLLAEEIGELAKCIRKSAHTNMRTDASRRYQEDSAEEVADILMVLTALANRLDIDMEQAFRDKEQKNQKRVWK